VFYAIVVLAIFKLIPITLTLSHIGGFILSIGMAVDANILIFERMKEEVRIGRTLASSMEVGFNRAWPAIRDSNFSTIITCLVLLWFGDRLGGGLVTGFAISLLIGVLLSMFTAVVLSRNLLQLLAWVGLGRRIALFTPEKVQRTASTVGGGR
jgi:preprotein translocase subunit SecD